MMAAPDAARLGLAIWVLATMMPGMNKVSESQSIARFAAGGLHRGTSRGALPLA